MLYSERGRRDVSKTSIGEWVNGEWKNEMGN